MIGVVLQTEIVGEDDGGGDTMIAHTIVLVAVGLGVARTLQLLGIGRLYTPIKVAIIKQTSAKIVSLSPPLKRQNEHPRTISTAISASLISITSPNIAIIRM